MILFKVKHNQQYYDVGQKWNRNNKNYIVTFSINIFRKYVFCVLKKNN